ncbi:hypothetical protein GRH67_26485 [Pseudomonas aeruginosa]|nr:hypothetical protein [Pseudomonas aeruginosa]
MLIRHLSHGEDFRLNRCPGSVDHYNVPFGRRRRRCDRDRYSNGLRRTPVVGLVR